jgi:hypothetical protein
MLQILIKRFSEPSSWAVIFTGLTAIGVTTTPGIAQNIALVGAGLAGLLGIFIPEGEKK